MATNELDGKRAASGAYNVNGDQDISQRRWFCVAAGPAGIMFNRTMAEPPAGCIEMVSGASISWFDYLAVDFEKEAPIAAAELGFSQGLASSLTGESPLNYEDFDTELGMRIPTVNVKEFDVRSYPLLLLMKKNFILTIHPRTGDRRFMRLRRYAETILKKIPAEAPAADRLTILLTRIIDENSDRNFEHLREIDERGDKLNEIMTYPVTPRARLGPEIYYMKHALITYMSTLWDTVDVLHTLRFGDAELLSDDPKLLEKLGILEENVNRQIGLAEHMSDVLASGLEVLQTIYNNQLQSLNNRIALVMTYLTIVGTAVLVPNTLATMLSNAVFDIGPRDMGWYLALMIGSTVAATSLVYWWVRRSGWIPRKMD
ncbi:MAG: CorA family divalent cation transporter [Chloroflexota bacterium]